MPAPPHRQQLPRPGLSQGPSSALRASLGRTRLRGSALPGAAPEPPAERQADGRGLGARRIQVSRKKEGLQSCRKSRTRSPTGRPCMGPRTCQLGGAITETGGERACQAAVYTRGCSSPPVRDARVCCMVADQLRMRHAAVWSAGLEGVFPGGSSLRGTASNRHTSSQAAESLKHASIIHRLV